MEWDLVELLPELAELLHLISFTGLYIYITHNLCYFFDVLKLRLICLGLNALWYPSRGTYIKKSIQVCKGVTLRPGPYLG